MATTADIKRILEIVATGVGALEEIVRVGRGVLTSPATSDQITGVLAAIVAVSEAVLGGLGDNTVVTVDQVNSAIAKLKGTLAANDAAADAAIDAKFPK